MSTGKLSWEKQKEKREAMFELDCNTRLKEKKTLTHLTRLSLDLLSPNFFLVQLIVTRPHTLKIKTQLKGALILLAYLLSY